jgi:hypothetical protein
MDLKLTPEEAYRYGVTKSVLHLPPKYYLTVTD